MDRVRWGRRLDIPVTDQSAGTALHVAESVLKQLGYQPVAGFIPGKKEQALVVGRESGAELFLGVDFLLPSNPWVDDAVRRGQSNLLDYGFVSAPTITVEDLYLAKVLAHQENKDRVLDRDDVESIFYVLIFLLNHSYLPWNDFEKLYKGASIEFRDLLQKRMHIQYTKRLFSMIPSKCRLV